MTLALQTSPEIISKTVTRAVLEDSYGFIWHGGSGGLFKYDGYESKARRPESADSAKISLGTVYAILEDKSRDLWIGSANGLFRYERQTDKIVPCFKGKFVTQTGSASIVYALFVDAAGRLWIGTETSLYVVKKSGAEPLKVLEGHDFRPQWQLAEGVFSIVEDRRGRIYAATSDGLWRIQSDFSFRRLAPGAGAKNNSLGFRITDAETAGGDTIWLASSTGLWIFETQNERFSPIPLPEKAGKRLSALTFDRQKHLWLAISGQIWERSPDGSIESATGPPAPFYQVINNVAIDRFGNLWAGGYSGLAKIELAANRALPFYKVVGDTPDQDNASLRLMQDSAGGFWFRMINSGLGFCSELGGTFEIVLQPALDVADGEIKHFCTDADGNVWVLTLTKGLYRFPKGSKREQSVFVDDSLRLALGLFILADRLDNRLLWFSSQFGLCSVDRFTFQRHWFFPKKDLPWLDKTSIGSIEQDDGGNIWCVTRANERNVVICFDRTSGKFSGEPDPAKRPDYVGTNHLKRVSKDTLWLATTMGMLVIDTRRNTQFLWNRPNGFPGAGAGSIVPDGRGNVWFTSGQKICRWDGRAFECFSARKESEGFLYANATLTRDGLVMFGGKSGIHVFDPAKIRKDTLRPRVYLTGFKVLNKAHSLGNALELVQEIRQPFDSKVLTFEFAAVHHLQPGDVKYRHKLEGFEPDWVETGSRERWATYTNLSPGAYTFKVMAANADGLWTEEAEGLSIRLVILPPWYRSWWAYLFYIVFGLGLLLAIRRFELRRHLAQAEARRLQELDLAKNRLYTNITHEFRTPLTVILGMEEQVRKNPGAWLDEGLGLIRRNGKQLLHLVNQMLDLAKLESGHLPLRLVQGDIVAYLRYLTESFHSYADSKDIRLHFRSDMPEMVMDYDPEKLQTVASNLLSNAVKFTPAGGDVYIELRQTVDGRRRIVDGLMPVNHPPSTVYRPPSVVIHISDTGHGIAPGHLPHIFDRFYQADDSTTRTGEGTGIGLALVKELVQLMGGNIAVESEPGRGVKFSIQLPVARTAIKSMVENRTAPDDVLAGTVLLERETATETTTTGPGDRYTVLFVEDNLDVIAYLSSVLESYYRIETARNGQEGIDKALELIPDVIVSDVMMPGKDGFELCRTLKTDERTSHIPIILLTAKADHPSRLEGLSHGADAYLAKPFLREELLIRLEKLIELRRRLQARFQQTGNLRQTLQGQAQSTDDLFLQKVLGIVEDQMVNEEFGMPQLCKALNMSRTNLFRKLKALTGQSATDFIRHLRLEKAKVLLETTDMSVTEASYAVGFGSPNYFSRAFQEMFGITPKSVRKV